MNNTRTIGCCRTRGQSARGHSKRALVAALGLLAACCVTAQQHDGDPLTSASDTASDAHNKLSSLQARSQAAQISSSWFKKAHNQVSFVASSTQQVKLLPNAVGN